MPETLTLTTPITKPNTTGWSLDRVTISSLNKSIEIHLVGNDGSALTVLYPTPVPADVLTAHPTQPTGAAMLTTLNTANLTSNSLVRRIFTRLITDGYLTGTVGGTAE